MELLERIEAYLSTAQTSASRFGRRAAGDPRLVLDMRGGRCLRRKTASRLEAYLAFCEKELSGVHSPSSGGGGGCPQNQTMIMSEKAARLEPPCSCQ